MATNTFCTFDGETVDLDFCPQVFELDHAGV